jgi:excisionase family DNA binding protein
MQTKPTPQLRLKPLLCTRKEAAVLLACSVDNVDRLIADGELETVRISRQRVGIKMPSLEFLAEYGVKAGA